MFDDFQVVIPVHLRSEAIVTAQNLRDLGVAPESVLIVESVTSVQLTSGRLISLAARDGFRHQVCVKQSTSKAGLINTGRQVCSKSLLLVSDADVSWSSAALTSLVRAGREANTVAHVAQVYETSGQLRGAGGLRYEISERDKEWHVHVLSREWRESRPGPGLICVRTADFDMLGGYYEGFRGWGWEDMDFLSRAELAGLSLRPVGTVVHRSHDDAARTWGAAGASPTAQRNENIKTWKSRLEAGLLVANSNVPSTSRRVVVHLPT